MKKIYLFGTVLFLSLFVTPVTNVSADSIASKQTVGINLEPQADIIEWRYKVENGKLYKRLYNYSKEKWIGNWILIP